MKITKVNIPSSEASNGLSDIIMPSGLGEVVVLAGKNGSGKSRILNSIMKLSGKYNNPVNVSNLNDQIKALKITINSLTSLSEVGDDVLPPSKEKQLNQARLNLATFQKALEVNNFLHIDGVEDNVSVIPFVPSSGKLIDPAKLTEELQQQHFQMAKALGSKDLLKATLSTILTVKRNYMVATHPESGNEIEKEERERNINDYLKLNKMIQEVLGAEIGTGPNFTAKLFDQPLGECSLSQGQSILLQFCVALFAQGKDINGSILLMDEPENHLHPSVIIDMINNIKDLNPGGQIWIATHSVSLLSSMDSSSIWYVDNGKIERAGKKPKKILEGLLGNDEGIVKLREFIGLPAQLASNRFAYESLFEPQAIATHKNDPQTKQINNVLDYDSQTKILDFGAGKGRLLENIFELNNKVNQNKIRNNLTYVAYDPFEDDKKVCQSIIERVYEDSLNKYYNEFSKLTADHDDNTFDVVVMCNVLHEIPHGQWIDLFNENSRIYNLLKDDGFLLIVEVQQIPVGEKAHNNGFLLLDTNELKKLFKMKTKDLISKVDIEDKRLKSHLIPKNFLQNINKDSKEAAVKEAIKSAKENIKRIRGSEKTDYSTGMLHGFWTQQLANAILTLEEISGNL